MDVGNSTGENTDYRVTGEPGGMAMAHPEPRHGRLEPGEQHPVEVSFSESWTAEFLIGGKVVASTEIKSKTAKVELVRKGDSYVTKVS